MTDWLNPPYYHLPAPAPEYFMNGPFVAVRFAIAYGMGLAIDGDLKDPSNKFNNHPDLDAQYSGPIAYAKNLVAFAEALQENPRYYAPQGWDPVEAGLEFANTVFGLLKQIPVNRGDPESNNLFDSWAAGTGQLYGGHATPPAPDNDVNAETGQSAAPPNSIL